MPRRDRLVLLTYLISSSFTFLFPLLYPILQQATRLDTESLSLSIAAVFFVTSLAAPAIGRVLSSRHAGKVAWVAVAGIAIGAAGAMFIEGNALRFAAVAVFICANSAIATLTSRVLEASAPPEERPRAAARAHLVHNLGLGLAALIAHQLLDDHAVSLVVLDVVTTSALVLALLLRLRLERAEPAPPQTPKLQSSLPWGRRQVASVLGAFLALVVLFAHLTAQPALFGRLGLPIGETTTLMLAVNTIIVVITTYAVARRRASLSKIPTFIGGAVALAVGHALHPWSDDVASVAVATAIWSVGEGLLMPMIASIVLEAWEGSDRGTAAGYLVLVRRAAFVAAPLTTALIGRLAPPWFAVILGGLPLLSAALVVGASRPAAKAAPVTKVQVARA